MNIELTTNNLQKLCRICSGEGKYNLWQQKLRSDDDNSEIALHKIFRIFDGEISNLNLASEMPLICQQCFEELVQCHRFFKKLEKGNKQMKKLYAEALQIESEITSEIQLDILPEDANEDEFVITEPFIEEQYFEEHPVPTEDELVESQIEETYEPILFTTVNTKEPQSPEAIALKREITPSDNETVAYVSKRQRNHTPCNVQKDAHLVVTKFITATAQVVAEDHHRNDYILQQNNSDLRTMDYAAIEVCANNLDEIIDDDDMNPQTLPSNYSNVNDDSSQPIYMCKYCPQAFSIAQYLIAHVRKSHVCKFCTKAFRKTDDLHNHLKKDHKQHRCAICGKELSSHSNLRAHIKRLHGLQLPSQVALLDYKPSDAVQE